MRALADQYSSAVEPTFFERMEEIAARGGNYDGFDVEYYNSFLKFKPADFERLTTMLLVEQESYIHQIAGGRDDEKAILHVTRFVKQCLKMVGMGIYRFNAFGTYIAVTRIGVRPELHSLAVKIYNHVDKHQPSIKKAVKRTLPWLLSNPDYFLKSKW